MLTVTVTVAPTRGATELGLIDRVALTVAPSTVTVVSIDLRRSYLTP